jgi:hypothetical protein
MSDGLMPKLNTCLPGDDRVSWPGDRGIGLGPAGDRKVRSACGGRHADVPVSMRRHAPGSVPGNAARINGCGRCDIRRVLPHHLAHSTARQAQHPDVHQCPIGVSRPSFCTATTRSPGLLLRPAGRMSASRCRSVRIKRVTTASAKPIRRHMNVNRRSVCLGRALSGGLRGNNNAETNRRPTNGLGKTWRQDRTFG